MSKPDLTMIGLVCMALGIAATTAALLLGLPSSLGLSAIALAAVGFAVAIFHQSRRLQGIQEGLHALASHLKSDLKEKRGRQVETEKALREVNERSSELLRELRRLGKTTDALRGGVSRGLRDYGRLLDMELEQKSSRIVEFPITSVFPKAGKMSVPLALLSEDTEHFNPAERLYVVAVAGLLQPKRIFEFGTFSGKTTYYLAKACPNSGIVTIDLPQDNGAWIKEGTGSYTAGTPEDDRIKQIRQDSTTLDTAPYRGEFDFIWVDGGHDYEIVKSDTHKAFEMLKPGGVIMWHDYKANQPGLIRFFKEFTQTRPLFKIRATSLLLHLDGVDPESFESDKHDWQKEVEIFKGAGSS